MKLPKQPGDKTLYCGLIKTSDPTVFTLSHKIWRDYKDSEHVAETTPFLTLSLKQIRFCLCFFFWHQTKVEMQLIKAFLTTALEFICLKEDGSLKSFKSVYTSTTSKQVNRSYEVVTLVGQTLCRVAACFMKISIFGSSASEEEGMRYIVVSTLCPTRSSGYVLFYNYTDVSDEAVMV